MNDRLLFHVEHHHDNMETTIKLEGKYILRCHDKDGNLRWEKTVNNIITSAGKAQLALLAGDATATPFTYLAVGTSSTAVAVGDTTLNAEITDTGLARAAGTVSRTTTTVTNDTLQITYTWTATGSKTIEEIGVFNASSSGTMLSHALTGSNSVVNTNTLSASFLCKFS